MLQFYIKTLTAVRAGEQGVISLRHLKYETVIVVNEALKLPRGKLSAQVAHASVASLLVSQQKEQQEWLKVGMPKVVLSAENEDEVLSIYSAATAANLPTELIKDAGKTVVSAGTITCVGIGSAKAEEINKISGQLKLIS